MIGEYAKHYKKYLGLAEQNQFSESTNPIPSLIIRTFEEK